MLLVTTSTQVVRVSVIVTKNSPFQDYVYAHLDNHINMFTTCTFLQAFGIERVRRFVFFKVNDYYLPGRRHTLDLSLAQSALAGLASTEDFTKIRLRKTAGPDEKDEFRGTKPVMLIHIKGK